jgi:hypothetical protein
LEREIAERRAGGMREDMKKLSPRESSDMGKMEVSGIEKI